MSTTPRLTELHSPNGLAVWSDGTVLVTDTGNNRVLKISTDGRVSVFAGTGMYGSRINPHHATKTQLNYPTAIVAPTDGTALISDTVNHRVLKITVDGHVTVFAGTGQSGSRIDPNGAINTQLNYPQGLTFLPDGTVLISDTNNHRVLRVSPDRMVSVFAGTGKLGTTIEPNDATKTELWSPEGITALADGTILVADGLADRVLRVSRDGSAVSVFAGTGQQGSMVDANDATKTELSYPKGITALADGTVLIADWDNKRVLVITTPTPTPTQPRSLQDLTATSVLDSLQGELEPTKHALLRTALTSDDQVTEATKHVASYSREARAMIVEEIKRKRFFRPPVSPGSHSEMIANQLLDKVAPEKYELLRAAVLPEEPTDDANLNTVIGNLASYPSEIRNTIANATPTTPIPNWLKHLKQQPTPTPVSDPNNNNNSPGKH